MFEALRIAYLQIERHAFECVVVTFDLSTQIACYQREREVVVGVVIVEAEIDGKRPRGVLFVGGVDDFGIDSAPQGRGDVVGVDTVENDVFG